MPLGGGDRTNESTGLCRVSSTDQNLSRQLMALAEWGIEESNLFTDKASGKDFERPAYKRMIRKLQQGDVLVVKSIDRLGRNYDEVLSEWRYIVKEKQSDIVVLDMPLLDTRRKEGGITGTLLTDIVLELLSYVAHIERENTRSRQAEGIAAAKARGVRFGRPVKRPKDWPSLKNRVCEGKMSKRDLASFIGVDVTTVYRWFREDKSASQEKS